MRLERITLRNFRGVKESTVEFGPGVTIVAGPNEIGKSSIAEAIRLLRTTKHSSKAQAVKSLQPVGRDVGPEVELEFHSRGHEVWVRKQWLREAATELRISGAANEQHSGEGAHERLNSLLSENIDVELFDALEVVQGSSLERAELVGLRSLTQALDSSSAPVADHDDLMEKIEAEYDQHFTKAGRPKGPYQQAAAAVEDLREELALAEEKSREMDRFTVEVERARTQLAADESDLKDAQEHLMACRSRDEALSGLRQAAEAAQESMTNAVAAADHARAEVAARTAQQQLLDEQVQALSQLRQQVEERETEFAELRSTGDDLVKRRDAARARLREARDEATALAAAVEYAVDREELEALTSRLDDARDAQERRLAAASVIANSHVDADLLEQITAAHADLQVARATHDAAAARVIIRPSGSHPVNVGGEEVTDEQQILVTDPVVVQAPGVVRIEVQPGILPEDLNEQVRRAEDALTGLLEAGQVADLSEARAVAARRAEAREEQSLAEQGLTTALDGHTLEELQERHAAVHARLEARRAPERSEGPEPVPDAADLADLRDALAQAKREVETLEEAHTNTQDALEGHQEHVSELRDGLIRAQSDQDHSTDAVERAKKALAEAREQNSDEALAEALRRAEETVSKAHTARQLTLERLQEANPQAVALELANAQEWVESAGVRMEETKARLQRVTALLEDRAGLGLYDEVQRLEAELRAARQTHQRLRRRAEAARVLREAMINHRAQAHARYVAPFAKRIESLGRIVFGADFEVDITPDLHIAARTLNGQTVPFDSLSAGAKEQLGLLGRLAAAALVDPVEGAPLILDDTLGYADEERLGALGAVLNDVGKNAQIIVLTCQPRRFSRVGGAKMVHLAAEATA